MARLIKGHQACDACGSHDAKAYYDDSEHCFSCGYHRNLLLAADPLLTVKEIVKGYQVINLVDEIPKEFKQWLLKYRLFSQDIQDAGIKFDTLSQRLMLPTAGESNFQGRSLDEEPKYLTFGEKIPTTFGVGSIVVLVEDWVSAYRIGKQARAIALLGTKVPLSELAKHIKTASRVYIWLDGDTSGITGASKLMNQLEMVYPDKVFQVVTHKDPKCYSDTDIKALIGI